jgi:hypothetical protein
MFVQVPDVQHHDDRHPGVPALPAVAEPAAATVAIVVVAAGGRRRVRHSSQVAIGHDLPPPLGGVGQGGADHALDLLGTHPGGGVGVAKGSSLRSRQSASLPADQFVPVAPTVPAAKGRPRSAKQRPREDVLADAIRVQTEAARLTARYSGATRPPLRPSGRPL